jgi:hypothetical protein
MIELTGVKNYFAPIFFEIVFLRFALGGKLGCVQIKQFEANASSYVN